MSNKDRIIYTVAIILLAISMAALHRRVKAIEAQAKSDGGSTTYIGCAP